MNPTPNDSTLTRSQLLRLDDLGDELDQALAIDSGFDVESFLSRVSHPGMADFLREEANRILRNKRQSESNVIAPQPTQGAIGIDSFQPGSVIDEFELTELVGRGATAVVWRALNRKLDRPVALKFPKEISTQVASRLQRESQAVARLHHPNIATIYEIRSHEGRTFLVSEYVDGVSLQEKLDSGTLDRQASLMMLVDIVEAIAYSHSMKVVHRDLKPQNILIRDSSVPVVVDFGLARVLQSELEVLTCEGDCVGTPAYMAPEQANGQSDVDERVDIYTLGVLMFQMLSGRLPFEGNVQSVLHQIVYSPPPAPSSVCRELDRDLDTICLKCLEKEPEKRFQSAQNLAWEIRRYLNGEPIRSRPISSMEKIARWRRQKPVEATLSLMLLISVVVLAIGATTYAVAMQEMRDVERGLRVNAENAEIHANKLKAKVEVALAESIRQKTIATERARSNKISADLLQSIFQDAEPVMWVLKGDGISRGEPPTLKQLFQNAAQRLENEYSGSPQTKAELLESLADSCRSTGALDLSRRLLEEAKQIRVGLASLNGPNATLVNARGAGLVYNQFLLAQLEHDIGNYDLARQMYENCLKSKNDYATASPQMVELEAKASFHLGRLLLSQHRNFDAKSYFENAIKCFAYLSKEDEFLARASQIGIQFCDLKPGQFPTDGPLAEYFQKDTWAQRVIERLTYIVIARSRKDWSRTAQQYQELLAILREKLPEDNRWHLLALGDYAHVQLQVGYYEEAMRAILIAIEHGNRIAPHHPKLIEAKVTLGKELSRGGLFRDAIKHLEDAVACCRARNDSHEKVLDDLWMEISWCYIQMGVPHKASSYCEELAKEVDRWPSVKVCWLRFLQSHACRHLDPQQASTYLSEAYQLAKRLWKPPENGIWCHRMATVFMQYDDTRAAVEFARAGVECDQKRFFEEHPRVANRRILLGRALYLDGQFDEARTQFTLALHSRVRFLSETNPLVIEARQALQNLN